MQTGKNSKQRSQRAGTTALGRLVRSLQQAAADVRGGIKLTSYDYRVPEHADVPVIARNHKAVEDASSAIA